MMMSSLKKTGRVFWSYWFTIPSAHLLTPFALGSVLPHQLHCGSVFLCLVDLGGRGRGFQGYALSTRVNG